MFLGLNITDMYTDIYRYVCGELLRRTDVYGRLFNLGQMCMWFIKIVNEQMNRYLEETKGRKVQGEYLLVRLT